MKKIEPIHVYSEIGRLKKVLLHYPGREFENLIPKLLDELLFDDTPYLKVAQQEHNFFSKVLTDFGTEVVYVEKLFQETLDSESNIKEQFLDVFLRESRILSRNLIEKLKIFFLNLSTQDMVKYVIGGIRRNELLDYKPSTLSEYVYQQKPFYLYPMPNIIFMRDPFSCIGNGININVMHSSVRHRETLLIDYIFRYHPWYKNNNVSRWFNRDLQTTLEGGDQLVLSKNILAIGISERTEAYSIEQVAHNLFSCDQNSFNKVVAIQIPSKRSFMHLDTVLTQVDRDKFTIFSRFDCDIRIFILTPNRGSTYGLKIQEINQKIDKTLSQLLETNVTLIQCGNGDVIDSEREQWNDGANTLAIAPGEVVVYDRNSITNELLDKNGIKVHTVPSSELSRGRGGPRCMSMPLYRDDI